jgi:hypothetical protein
MQKIKEKIAEHKMKKEMRQEGAYDVRATQASPAEPQAGSPLAAD